MKPLALRPRTDGPVVVPNAAAATATTTSAPAPSVGLAAAPCQEPADRRWRLGVYTAIGVGGVLALYVMVSTMMDAASTNTDPTSPDRAKIKRQQARGTVASIIVSLTFGILNFLVDLFGDINPATSTALVGMVFGGTLGFLMDNALGSDEGFKLGVEVGPFRAWRYALGLMTTGAYMRYTLTVLLDMFVSLIIFKPLYAFFLSLPYLRCNDALANGFASTAIGLTTFQAYANVTRFAWAYPATNSQTKKSWIRGSTMQVIASVASVVFLAGNTQAELTPDEFGINHPKVKLWVVLGSMCLIWGLSTMDEMEPKLDIEVVPNNIFNVVAKASSGDDGKNPSRVPVWEVGQQVDSSELIDVNKRHEHDDSPNRLGSGKFTVIQVMNGVHGTVYKVQRVVPAFAYKPTASNRTADEVLDRSWMGSVWLLLLGTACFGTTILGTSKKERRVQYGLFGAFMLLTAALAAPGF